MHLPLSFIAFEVSSPVLGMKEVLLKSYLYG